MSTYDVTVTGPSPRMAMLAALIRKMTTTGHAAWTTASTFIAGAARHGRTLAHTTLAVIGSPAGYQIAITGIRTAITTVWRGLKAAATWATRTAGRVTDKAIGLIGTVSPALAARLTRAKKAVTRPDRRGRTHRHRCGWRPPVSWSGCSPPPTWSAPAPPAPPWPRSP